MLAVQGPTTIETQRQTVKLLPLLELSQQGVLDLRLVQEVLADRQALLPELSEQVAPMVPQSPQVWEVTVEQVHPLMEAQGVSEVLRLLRLTQVLLEHRQEVEAVEVET